MFKTWFSPLTRSAESAPAGTTINRADPAPAPAAPQPAPVPAPAPVPSAPVQTRAEIDAEIRALATAAPDLPPGFLEGLVAIGASADAAREAVRSYAAGRQVVTRGAPIVSVGFSNDDPTIVRSRIAEALYATRANPRHQLSDAARPYTSLTMVDIARECCRMAGVSTSGLTPHDTITRALHTTSDFPAIFADTANRTLRAAYTAAPATMKRVARQSTAKDFRAKTKIQSADLAELRRVNEHGEYKYSSWAEWKETYGIGTFGTIVGITRQMLINDDIGAFVDVTGKLGTASAEFENGFLVDLLLANAGLGPTMEDGETLFAAAHANVAGSGAALSADTLSAARLAMRRQKGINGRPIAVTPRYLLVPPELETLAETVIANVQPTRTDDVNVFGGKLELLVEPRLVDSKRWYVAADPVTAEGLEYSYLAGAEGPQTDSRQGFEVDGVEVKVRLDFGAAFLDFRSWYTNAGP